MMSIKNTAVPAFLYLLPGNTFMVKLEILQVRLHHGLVDHPKPCDFAQARCMNVRKEKWVIINKELQKYEHFCTSEEQ